MRTITKSNLGRKVLIVLYILVTVHNEGKELKVGTWRRKSKTEVMEECCLLIWALTVCSTCFLIQPRTQVPRVVSTHDGQGPPTRKCPQQTCLQDNLMEAVLITVSSCQIALVYVKLKSYQ